MVPLHFVADDTTVGRLDLPDGIAGHLFLLGGQLLIEERLRHLGMLAARTMAGLATRPLEINFNARLVTGRLAKPGRVALQADNIGLVFGRQQVERLGMFGFLPFNKLIKVAGRALLAEAAVVRVPVDLESARRSTR